MTGVVAGSIRSLHTHLREAPFWTIQAGVLGVTALHWLLEATGFPETHEGPLSSVIHVSVVLYLFPLVYAGLRYGFEGSLWTGAWIGLLATPNQFLWHGHAFEWVGELGFLAVVVTIGAVIAIPVEREQRERARAERAHRRAAVAGHLLQLTNDVTSLLVHTADFDRALRQALHRLVATMPVEAAAVVAWTEDPPSSTVLACHGLDPRDPARLRDVVDALDLDDLRVGAVQQRDRTCTAPFTLRGARTGALVVWCGRSLSSGDRQLLSVVGRQIGVALENLRMHREEQRALHAHVQDVTRAQEEERRRIARDLHDVATHELLLVRRDLEDADGIHGAGTRSPSSDVLATAHRRLGEVIDTLRQFSRDLRPSVLDPLGLAPALEWLAMQVDGRARATVRAEVDGRPRRLDAEAELALYRIGEEALRNAVQHGDASSVCLRLTFAPGRVRLTVQDDGRGISAHTAAPRLGEGHGLGLPGMAERAALIGARIRVSDGVGDGAQVRVDYAEPSLQRPGSTSRVVV